MSRIELTNVTKRWGQFYAVDNLSMVIEDNAFVTLLGPSGCGKSTLLRLISGLIQMDEGELTLDGVPVTAPGADRGFMFQEHTLFPWLSIYDNIAFGLRARGIYKQEKDRVDEFIEMVGLKGFEHSYPHQLSGGMRQRVMIAMALACKPDLLLADEPTTALDATIQGQILSLITEQSRKRGMAVLFITHDLGVVARIADNVGVMYAGHLVEHAPTAELFRNPLHPYTRGLMRSAPGRAAMGMQRLPAITGSVPSLDNMPEGCPFAPRCDEALPRCFESAPVARCENGHSVACWAV